MSFHGFQLVREHELGDVLCLKKYEGEGPNDTLLCSDRAVLPDAWEVPLPEDAT